MNTLEEARNKINAIDEAMAKLFEQRMQAVEEVIAYKQEHDMPVLDTSREQEILTRNMNRLKHDAYRKYYEAFQKNVMELSKRHQKMILSKDVVGYQGIEGAFSHIACGHLFPDERKVRYASFEDVIKAVREHDVCYGVLPFENSYTGEVGEVLDLLMKYDGVHIQKIYDLEISQNLLGIKGADLHDVKQVYSKDQAIHQSRKFLEGRDFELIPYPNTALAAEYVAKQKDKSKAAIAAKENASLYDLDILASDINTSAQNTTRFIVISDELKLQGNTFSLLFTVPHTAGSLAEAMQIIADRGYNMQSIKSRSRLDRAWEYYFYVEIAGRADNEKAKQLLRDLSKLCEDIKILGAYDKESRDEQ